MKTAMEYVLPTVGKTCFIFFILVSLNVRLANSRAEDIFTSLAHLKMLLMKHDIFKDIVETYVDEQDEKVAMLENSLEEDYRLNNIRE